METPTRNTSRNAFSCLLGTPTLYMAPLTLPKGQPKAKLSTFENDRTTESRDSLSQGMVHPACRDPRFDNQKGESCKALDKRGASSDAPSHPRPPNDARWQSVRVITSTTNRARGHDGAHCGMRRQRPPVDALAPVPLANGLKPRNVEPPALRNLRHRAMATRRRDRSPRSVWLGCTKVRHTVWFRSSATTAWPRLH